MDRASDFFKYNNDKAIYSTIDLYHRVTQWASLITITKNECIIYKRPKSDDLAFCFTCDGRILRVGALHNGTKTSLSGVQDNTRPAIKLLTHLFLKA